MPPFTPDRKYFVVEGALGPRLWRATNPKIDERERQQLVAELMDARRSLRRAPGGDSDVRQARQRVQRAKVALGERGPVWWNDGAPDFNRRLVRNTPYADWWEAFSAQQSA